MKISLFCALVFLFFACESKQRYTQQSAEIEIIKSSMGNYINGDWDAYQSHYAEGAKLFFNATEDKPATIQQTIAQQKLEIELLSSYSIDRENENLEMVFTDEGETWVNYWGTWKGTMAASGTTYEIPIHITYQFVQGKIVKAFGYWDNSPIRLDAMARQLAT